MWFELDLIDTLDFIAFGRILIWCVQMEKDRRERGNMHSYHEPKYLTNLGMSIDLSTIDVVDILYSDMDVLYLSCEFSNAQVKQAYIRSYSYQLPYLFDSNESNRAIIC